LVKNTWLKQREIAALQVKAADAAEVVAGAKVAAAVIRVSEARDKTEAREGGWVYPGNGNDHSRHRLPATELLDYKMLKRLLKVLKLPKLMKENGPKTCWSLDANKNQLRLRNLAKQHREEEMAALQENGMLNKQGELALGGKYDDVADFLTRVLEIEAKVAEARAARERSAQGKAERAAARAAREAAPVGEPSAAAAAPAGDDAVVAAGRSSKRHRTERVQWRPADEAARPQFA
jgi:hypothetical protein